MTALVRLAFLALLMATGLLAGSPVGAVEPTAASEHSVFTYDGDSVVAIDTAATTPRSERLVVAQILPVEAFSAVGHVYDSSVSLVAPRTLDLPISQTWGRLDTLDDHFARHGADFGATSADDYARQASEFLQQPGTLTKIDPKTGVIRVYDPATNTFGAYNPTGTTRTFYMPDPAKHGYPTNLDYWNLQPG